MVRTILAQGDFTAQKYFGFYHLRLTRNQVANLFFSWVSWYFLLKILTRFLSVESVPPRSFSRVHLNRSLSIVVFVGGLDARYFLRRHFHFPFLKQSKHLLELIESLEHSSGRRHEEIIARLIWFLSLRGAILGILNADLRLWNTDSQPLLLT